MRILITGSKGLLGAEIIRCLSNGNNEVGTTRFNSSNTSLILTDREELDITKLDIVRESIREIKPDAVINCAAYVNADACESGMERQKAFNINAIGARNLAIACEDVKAKFMHFSSDYVFSGKDRDIPYTECDTPDPLSVYGNTKLLGEKYAAQFCSRYFVLRTAWMYGKSGKSFVETIIRNGKEKGRLSVVNDQRGTPTNSADLAFHAVNLLGTDEFGLYHASGNGECTWYDFAVRIVQLSGINVEVTPCTSIEYKTPARRPTYSVLENTMFNATIGNKFRNWDDALKQFIEAKYR